jgi:hypothetical protein
LRDEHVLAQAILYLCGWRTFEEQLKRFAEVVSGLLNRVSLTGDIQFGAQGYESVSFAMNNGRQSLAHFHSNVSLPSRPNVRSGRCLQDDSTARDRIFGTKEPKHFRLIELAGDFAREVEIVHNS